MSVTQTNSELVRVHDRSRANNCYTMMSPMCRKGAWLIDRERRFVHQWRLSRVLGEMMRVLLSRGNMLCGVRTQGAPVEALAGSREQLSEMDWDSNIQWKYDDLYLNSDENCRLENGNAMVTHWTLVPRDLAIKVKGGIPGSERDGTMWGDVLPKTIVARSKGT